jgi:glycosyltransferase involved in cell wall biosynthesis
MRARRAARALLDQTLPAGAVLDVILVDDGSADGTVQALRILEPAARVLALAQNQGRSGARNAGAAMASGDCIVFMDCDCIPADGFIAAHLQQIQRGAVASCGHVTGASPDFWGRYQKDASARRKGQHAAGTEYSGSSSNLAVRRSDFEAIGGFDIGYGRYGFEDRDLLIRLAQRGSIAWTSATVQHQDQLKLTHVAAKMAEAGQYTSRRFADQHPEAYRKLHYAAIDAHLHPILKPLARLATPIATILARAFDQLGCEHWLPYALAKRIVKAISALAYFGGTARSV